MGLTQILFIVVVCLLIIERLAELRSAKRNFEFLKQNGGREFGYSHYPVIVAMHIAFFISLTIEFIVRNQPMPTWWPLPVVLLLFGQSIRLWARRTMAKRWTTRVIVIQGERLIQQGLYRLVPHPIYLAVALELFSLPLIFGLYVTCVLFTILNGVILLAVRIPMERMALEWSQGKETDEALVK